MSRPTRNTATRDRHRRYIARTKPPCHLCGEDIDYSLPHLDPMSFVVDHVQAIARGGLDELENKAAAHRRCNEAKGAKLLEDMAAYKGPREYVTDRTW
ncbi:HNH endonuclease [Rhodococcus pyridinivorans]